MSDLLTPEPMHEKRPLTPAEIALLRWLLKHSEPEHYRLGEQIPFLSVASSCSCGCATISFALNDTAVDRKGEQVISDFLGKIGEEPVGVMLFETNGNLSTLEAYSCSGQLTQFDFPKISTLHPY
jgi:hypothetical protein